MILVDSSVWISYFRNSSDPRSDLLHSLFGQQDLGVADLVRTEVLQGVDTEAEARRVADILDGFETLETGGREAATEAAANYRALRRRGTTVRSTIDTLIATACIRGGHTLLHNDRDFDAFEEHLGLQVLR